METGSLRVFGRPCIAAKCQLSAASENLPMPAAPDFLFVLICRSHVSRGIIASLAFTFSRTRTAVLTMQTVGILIFPDVEVLDFCGPYEVFSVAGNQIAPGAFQVFTIAQTPDVLAARNGLRVQPDYSWQDAPQVDVLIVPGGQGTRPLVHDSATIDWIRRTTASAELVLSVCTGALLLGKAGLLDGISATTHHLSYDLLRSHAPLTQVREGVRLVDNGCVVTSAGVAAGIDMSLHIVGRLLGQATAIQTAKYIEYPWQPEPGESTV